MVRRNDARMLKIKLVMPQWVASAGFLSLSKDKPCKKCHDGVGDGHQIQNARIEASTQTAIVRTVLATALHMTHWASASDATKTSTARAKKAYGRFTITTDNRVKS